MLVSTVIKRLRYTVHDFDSSDAELTNQLLYASKFVASDASGIGTPWAVADLSFNPNPSEDYVCLTILRAASMLQQFAARKIAERAGTTAKLGPASIQTESPLPFAALDFIQTYAHALLAWKINKNLGAYRAIIGPANLAYSPSQID